jgi:hypothetical protein
MSRRLPFSLLLVAAGLIGACEIGKNTTNQKFELSFGLREGGEGDPRIVETYDHCCCGGRIAVARVTRMPPLDKSEVLQTELVVELSDAGTIIRRWGMPVDSVVAGISGSQIIVSEGEGKALSISENGDLAMTILPKDTDYGKLVECPAIKEFEGSAYLRCFELRDLASGKLRRIAYEEPCT